MVRRANRQYHDRVAGRYDQVYDTPYWRFYRDVSWRHLKAFLPAHRPVHGADLGCGTGWFGLKLLKAGFDVTFLDPSGKMLARAQDAVEKTGTRGRETRFVHGELEDMSEIADESLDFATAQGDPLSFCEDPALALRELRRILKPEGHAVLSVDSRVAGVRKLAENKKPDAALDLLRTGRTEWTGDGERFGMKMFDPDELDRLLVHAGFEPVSRIAKTCVVQRSNQAWLEDAQQRRKLMQAEESVHKLPQYFGMAGHFQVAAKRR